MPASKAKKIAYIMITDHDPHLFVQKVNKCMQEGWQVWGSASTPNWSEGSGLNIQYCQAMVLYETKQENEVDRTFTPIE